jgi:hypothetical protein
MFGGSAPFWGLVGEPRRGTRCDPPDGSLGRYGDLELNVPLLRSPVTPTMIR